MGLRKRPRPGRRGQQGTGQGHRRNRRLAQLRRYLLPRSRRRGGGVPGAAPGRRRGLRQRQPHRRGRPHHRAVSHRGLGFRAAQGALLPVPAGGVLPAPGGGALRPPGRPMALCAGLRILAAAGERRRAVRPHRRGAGRLAAARRNQDSGSAGEGPRRDQRHAAVPVRPGARPLAVQLRPRRAGRAGRAATEPALFGGSLGACVVGGSALEPSDLPADAAAGRPMDGRRAGGNAAAMRIGFDVSQTGAGKAGCGYYAEGLIKALEALGSGNEVILYPAFGDLFWDPQGASAAYRTDNPSFRRLKPPDSFEESQRFWSHPEADFEARIGSPDIVHSNNFFCPRGLRRARLVYTLYDLSFLVDPSWSTEANRVGCLDGVFRAATSADWMVMDSEYTRRHFLEIFPHYPAERTEVVYPGSRYTLDGAGPLGQAGIPE